jgi:ketosteroid isomerase-like protein
MPAFRRSPFALVLLLCASLAQAADCESPAEAPRLQLLADAVDARWNARDAAGLSAHYGPEATLTLEPTALHLQGRLAVQRYFEQSLSKLPPEMRHLTRVQRATALPGGLCLTDSQVLLQREAADGARSQVAEFRTYTLLRPRDEGWELLAVRAVALNRNARS